MEESKEQKKKIMAEMTAHALETFNKMIDNMFPLLPQLLSNTFDKCLIKESELKLLFPKLDDNSIKELSDSNNKFVSDYASKIEIVNDDKGKLKKFISERLNSEMNMDEYDILTKVFNIVIYLHLCMEASLRAKNMIITEASEQNNN